MQSIANSFYSLFGDKDSKTELSKFLFFRQKSNWDCGLACCVMALKFLHKDCRDSGEEETIIESVYHHPLVERRNENIPLWTIDLFGK